MTLVEITDNPKVKSLAHLQLFLLRLEIEITFFDFEAAARSQHMIKNLEFQALAYIKRVENA